MIGAFKALQEDKIEIAFCCELQTFFLNDFHGYVILCQCTYKLQAAMRHIGTYGKNTISLSWGIRLKPLQMLITVLCLREREKEYLNLWNFLNQKSKTKMSFLDKVLYFRFRLDLIIFIVKSTNTQNYFL